MPPIVLVKKSTLGSVPTRLPATLAVLLFFGALIDGIGIDVARADNPFVQTIYTADPAPLVYNDRLYVFMDHDNDGATYFNMTDWRLFSTVDMANWQDHGSPLSLADFSWADENAWAPQVIPRNNKFYMYVPIRHHTTSTMAIGVGVSDTITGPFHDALGKPLVENGDIDPTVFIDDDGQAYLYWGNPDLWYVKLNQDMISYSGSPTKFTLTTAGFGPRSGSEQRPTSFEEAPWVYKRNGIYYLIYAANCCSEDIRYSTGTSALGPWTYRGVIMATAGSSFTNHEGIVDYKNNSYFFYHNGALPGGGGYQRSVCVERFVYNSDGTIPTIQMTTAGPPQIGTLNPYVRQEAETAAWSQGVETESKALPSVPVQHPSQLVSHPPPAEARFKSVWGVRLEHSLVPATYREQGAGKPGRQ
ncbi:Arabinoxylan arabinofuranohydrolase [Psilocybe cubensis]|uniref:Arabinoxylan arabinofuranohydrolase n=1 Tax=Psilocybe cubensis TaxID=181762 RepID=A0ACB8GUN5_PSICU|nr:Arabinoxylan arabinofuranohydrolase [Psilocybe cubensis]KAH9479067.1 Arabinoxylan arabinofuranohydrolase [Psilocybe cubensis]